jgi:hypothetical protein
MLTVLLVGLYFQIPISFFSPFVSIDSSQDGLTTAIDYGQSVDFAGKGTGLGTGVWRHW